MCCSMDINNVVIESTARILGYPQPNFRALYAHKGDNVTENQAWAYAG